ncbi:MAG: bis(5'-nucleosyl)-tetraphosphatase (symmetrical) YqeK, partial [Candidatus Sumerlaeaceae bacterium]|nr:bis(5'-nucleosyl)-tetraphosphatase (symmetrical) YqeK [Candidatus Sumerlaeaceae bacterium]
MRAGQTGIFDSITRHVAGMLDAHRFSHTLGVTQLAVSLAVRHRHDAAKCAQAALLHDAAKCLPREQQAALAARSGYPVDGWAETYPSLLHGPAAAQWARESLGVTDPEVLDAVAYHPTGCGRPSPVLEILMAADYCEPLRDFPGVDGLRRGVMDDLRRGLVAILA